MNYKGMKVAPGIMHTWLFNATEGAVGRNLNDAGRTPGWSPPPGIDAGVLEGFSGVLGLLSLYTYSLLFSHFKFEFCDADH